MIEEGLCQLELDLIAICLSIFEEESETSENELFILQEEFF
jgi:hypothetical protein